jgi:hypothetical protein
MTKIRSSIFNLIPFLIIIAGALFVRLYGLSDYAFNDDESWHLVVADQKSLFDVILYNFQQEVHPPLSYIIWHLMLQVSSNDLWLRMSSIVPGILLIPSGYCFGRLYIGKAAGWAIAFIFAFGTLPVVISATIRAYSPLMLALIWMAIFAYKYSAENLKSKYLVYYSMMAVIAIELHHGAAFPLLAFGSSMSLQAFRNKNKKHFVAIALIHFCLALAVVGYAEILIRHYGLVTNDGYFEWTGDALESLAAYLCHFLTLFFSFISVAKGLVSIIFLFLLVALFLVPISLFKKKKWQLLHLVFTPIVALCFADSFGYYPFSHTLRNNLFLCISLIILYGYFVQMVCEYAARVKSDLDKNSILTFRELIKNKNLSASLLIYKVIPKLFQKSRWRSCFKPLAALFLTVLVVVHFFQNNFFRSDLPSCIELSISKSDKNLLHEKLAHKNTSDNVFVTIQKNIWDMQLMSKDHGQIEIITKNLAKFQNDKMTIYFTAFPAREKSVTGSMIEYKLFFGDLFSYLKSKKKFGQVKSITLFELGLRTDFISSVFQPQFVEIDRSKSGFYQLIRDRERDEMSWTIHSSSQVLDKFFMVPLGAKCGKEILILSFTTKFVEDEILAKRFFKKS